jgi:hypothetical protein
LIWLKISHTAKTSRFHDNQARTCLQIFRRFLKVSCVELLRELPLGLYSFHLIAGDRQS